MGCRVMREKIDWMRGDEKTHVHGGTVEGNHAHQHLVGEDAQRPVVGVLVVSAPVDDLRRLVRDSPQGPPCTAACRRSWWSAVRARGSDSFRGP